MKWKQRKSAPKQRTKKRFDVSNGKVSRDHQEHGYLKFVALCNRVGMERVQ